MVTYEVQYKCYLPDSYLPQMPQICYRYRKIGKVFWEKKQVVDIDHYALSRWSYEYYDDMLCSQINERVRIMRSILDKEYNGYLINYVEAMVEYEIMSDLINKEEERDTLNISLSFVTNGWKRTTVRLGK